MYEPSLASEMFQQLISTVPESRIAAGYLHCQRARAMPECPCCPTLPQILAVLRNHSEFLGYDWRANAQSPRGACAASQFRGTMLKAVSLQQTLRLLLDDSFPDHSLAP